MPKLSMLGKETSLYWEVSSNPILVFQLSQSHIASSSIGSSSYFSMIFLGIKEPFKSNSVILIELPKYWSFINLARGSLILLISKLLISSKKLSIIPDFLIQFINNGCIFVLA